MDAKSGRPTRYSTIVSVNCYVNSADGEIRFPFLFFFFFRRSICSSILSYGDQFPLHSGEGPGT